MRRAGDVFSLLRARQAYQPAGGIREAGQSIRDVSAALVCAQPEMTPLLRLASVALSAARTATDFQEVFRFAEEAAFRFIEETKRAAHASALHAADFIHNGVIVLTHSRSSTVSEAFLEARLAGRTFAVIATESRPMLEGRTVAESLSRKGIRVTLIADAAASLMMREVNLILVGADQVRPEVLINKIGTHVIALAAREKKLPVYAACDGSKFISKEYSDGLEPNERTASELWASAPPGIDIVNRYFEAVPIELFTGIITEAGVLSIDEASRRAEAASIDGELEDALDSRRGRIR